MYTIQTTRKITILGLLLLSILALSLALTYTTHAAGNKGCETDTAIISCNNVDVDAGGEKNTGVWSLLLTTINILTAGVGVLALAGIVYGAVLYTSAGGSPEQIKKARTVFVNVVVGVIAFAAMWGLLNFLIPGGVF